MSWVKIDDQMHAHTKVLGCSLAARGLWLTCISWVGDKETDGFLPEQIVRLHGGALWKKLVVELVEAGLWDREGRDFRFHDYLVYNKSHDQLEAEREVTARRQGDFRQRKRQDAPTAKAPHNASSNGRSNAVTPPVTTPVSNACSRIPYPVSRIPIPEASRQPGVVDTASARAPDDSGRHRGAAPHAGRRAAAALAMREGRGGEEAGALPPPPVPPPDPDATAQRDIDEALARYPDLAAELQAIEARKLAKGESIGSPQRWRAAMLQSLLRQRAQRQAAAAESASTAREVAAEARIVQAPRPHAGQMGSAPRPRRPLPPDWLPGVEEEEARRLLNAAREALLCRRDPSPAGPERDAKLLALAREYWERAHPDQAPPWEPAETQTHSDGQSLRATSERHGAVPVLPVGVSPQALQVPVREMAA